MISFGARHISGSVVHKIDKKNNTNDEVQASFVKLDPLSESDLSAVFNISQRWRSGEGYGACIANCMKQCNNAVLADAPNLHFFAITKQNDDFEDLDDEDILALAQIYSEDGEKKIEYLESDPKNSHKSQAQSRYAHAGTAMLNALKAMYFGEKIYLYSTADAVKFYENNKFATSDEATKEMFFYEQ